jgi:hypothetical protein
MYDGPAHAGSSAVFALPTSRPQGRCVSVLRACFDRRRRGLGGRLGCHSRRLPIGEAARSRAAEPFADGPECTCRRCPRIGYERRGTCCGFPDGTGSRARSRYFLDRTRTDASRGKAGSAAHQVRPAASTGRVSSKAQTTLTRRERSIAPLARPTRFGKSPCVAISAATIAAHAQARRGRMSSAPPRRSTSSIKWRTWASKK